MKMMWMMAFLLLPLAGLVYAGWHVWTLVPLSAAWRTAIIVVGVAAFLSLFLSVARVIDGWPLWLARWTYDISTSSIFVLLYLVMTFIALDVLRLVHVVPRSWLHQNAYTTIAVTLGLFAVFLLGNIRYRHKVRVPLSMTTAKHLERPVRLVLLSDLHVGYHNPRKELARWVDMINAEQPDAVLIAGDIIDGSLRPLVEERMAEEFRRIEAPVYACLGNHEYISGEPRAEQFYREAGITLLRDSAATLGRLTIIGRDDRSNPRRRPIAELLEKAPSAEGRFTVLLDHQPYHLEEAEQAGIDFQLSGHTHHGQVWPISWITDALYECAFGEHQRGQTRYYVSSGLGIWGGKYRIGTRSEFVVLRIEN
ncbi:MAG: metallophosphoesterase [Prevotella sp.]|nr:metallophosphoesterase [Prevotella sp.]